jgi:hypothetical protein
MSRQAIALAIAAALSICCGAQEPASQCEDHLEAVQMYYEAQDAWCRTNLPEDAYGDCMGAMRGLVRRMEAVWQCGWEEE